MTTQTQTLTSFLLARIAEDEAVAKVAAEEWTRAVCTLRSAVSAYGHVAHAPPRALAECEAKRNLVERYRKSGNPALYLLLADFSLTYADHPDFREEWRL